MVARANGRATINLHLFSLDEPWAVGSSYWWRRRGHDGAPLGSQAGSSKIAASS